MNPSSTSVDPAVAVVTGGSAGIGYCTSLRFLRRGYQVAICGRDPARLRRAEGELLREAGLSTEDHGRLLAIPCDLGRAGEPTRFIQQVLSPWGRIDVLVNNAGLAHCLPLEQTTDAHFAQMLQVNVRAVFETCRAAWKALSVSRGVIINVSSQAAVNPFTGFSVYGACKAWVDLFTQAIADEGRSTGIAAFSVRPGAVETKMLRELFPDFPADQTLAPDQVAAVIEALTLPEFRHSSSCAIPIRPCGP